MTDVKPYWQNYIDGAWVDGGAGRIDVFNPGNGERLAEHALADAADVDRAIAAARRVHLSGTSPSIGATRGPDWSTCSVSASPVAASQPS